MFGLLLALLILDGLLLMVIVLLQSGKGGGLASMGGGAGTDMFIGGRQAATLLTKATWITGGLFLGLSLILSILSSRQQRPQSILRDEFRQGAAQQAPAPVVPGATPVAPAGSAPAGAAPSGATGPAPATTPAPAPAAPKQ